MKLNIAKILLASALALYAQRAMAQPFSIDRITIAGGGARTTGGVYSVSGTIGQPDAGSLSGSGYTLAGGFWSEAVSVPDSKKLYLPLVNR